MATENAKKERQQVHFQVLTYWLKTIVSDHLIIGIRNQNRNLIFGIGAALLCRKHRMGSPCYSMVLAYVMGVSIAVPVCL